MTDAPLKGAARARSVLVLHDPDIVLVYDRATSATPTSFTQYWHLPAGQNLRVAGTRGVATAAGVSTTLLQLPAGAGKATKLAASRSGATRPIQGWVWSDPFHKSAAPVATVTRTGRSAAIATAVVAAPQGVPVSVATRPGRTSTYTFAVGSQRAVVTLGADGTLRRLR